MGSAIAREYENAVAGRMSMILSGNDVHSPVLHIADADLGADQYYGIVNSAISLIVVGRDNLVRQDRKEMVMNGTKFMVYEFQIINVTGSIRRGAGNSGDRRGVHVEQTIEERLTPTRGKAAVRKHAGRAENFGNVEGEIRSYIEGTGTKLRHFHMATITISMPIEFAHTITVASRGNVWDAEFGFPALAPNNRKSLMPINFNPHQSRIFYHALAVYVITASATPEAFRSICDCIDVQEHITQWIGKSPRPGTYVPSVKIATSSSLHSAVFWAVDQALSCGVYTYPNSSGEPLYIYSTVRLDGHSIGHPVLVYGGANVLSQCDAKCVELVAPKSTTRSTSVWDRVCRLNNMIAKKSSGTSILPQDTLHTNDAHNELLAYIGAASFTTGHTDSYPEDVADAIERRAIASARPPAAAGVSHIIIDNDDDDGAAVANGGASAAAPDDDDVQDDFM